MNYEKGGMQKQRYGEDDVIVRDCPSCNANESTEICKERGAVGVVRCRKCSLIYTNPIVKDPEKNYWGDEQKYYEEVRLILEGKAGCHRDPNYIADLKQIEKLKPEGNFLDIGTSMGFFLRHTRGKKWNVFGVEPSPVLSKMACEHFGLNVKNTYLENAGFEDNFFDVVTMTDVFEHIPEPKKMLSGIHKILKKDGILFIKVPNGKYNLLKFWIAKNTGRLKNYDVFGSYEHLTHYTQETLVKMLADCGFTLLNKALIGKPIQLPVWHKYVGRFYVYPSPWMLDIKNHVLRNLFYYISKGESTLRSGNIGYLAPNIIVIAKRSDNK